MQSGVMLRAVGSVLGVAALCAVALSPDGAMARTGRVVAAETPNPYAFAEDAKEVDGATSTAGSRMLVPGGTYKSSIEHPRAGASGASGASGSPGATGAAGSELYYRLELGARDNVYVSVTALPGVGSRVAYADGIRVSVQDADGFDCDYASARFGASRSPRPLTASATRKLAPDERRCQTAGTYYVVVERTVNSRSPVSSATEQPSSTEKWDLELYVASEPSLAKAGATTPPQDPDSGSDSGSGSGSGSATPVPPAGRPLPRAGGSSFGTARALGNGVWGDRVKAGQTRYYRVPVDWGQRLSATLEIGSGSRSGDFVTSGLVAEVFNPVRGLVEDADAAYDGRQRTTVMPTLPPVAYENRFAPLDRDSGMRFAGWYYLAVHLDPDVGTRFGQDTFGLTLRVGVAGERREGPVYAGAARPADTFGVTERDEAAARDGAGGSAGGGAGEPGADAVAAGGSGGGDPAMKVLAVAGIGTGTVLLAVLGVWRAVGRRRVARVG
ncbi:hypothetical protein [Streptomyces lasiicapitis]|uniref:Peptidase n=1 Tax=Streptomyces lasiicapitis TaxID=1923961 RepID=A0ABQ2LUU7_9ACTN|nr:hypothetical protein [Streptomyces lasiicapitis]GGO43376.1 hypothetical protein GCM10012286_27110 [Streptomyces lasiicapitis]